KRLGTEISTEEIEHILKKLGFTYNLDDENFTISIPTRRGDISIFEDMVEEVARIYGYDNLPYTLPSNASKPGGLTDVQLLKRNISRFLQSAGLNEALTYSLISKKDINRLLSPDVTSETYSPVSLAMPLSEDHQYLRLSILPELVNRLSYNRARK